MNIASFIEHTNLAPLAIGNDIKLLCAQAQQYQLKAVCISPYHTKIAYDILGETNIKIATVVGFPLGYSTIASKVEEIRRAIGEGVHELNISISLSAVKEGRWNFIQNEIDIMTTSCQLHDRIAKIIIEASILTEEEIKRLCTICNDVGVNFIETNSGYFGNFVALDTIEMMRQILSPSIGIKVVEENIDIEIIQKMITAGATRIGTSKAISLIA
jgi:deoxyribose-phosphate aldolase